MGSTSSTWLTDRAHGVGKFKVFQVDCPASKATPTAITPNGGPPAGGGGIARAEAFTPVAGAAAVGLAAVAGTGWFLVLSPPRWRGVGRVPRIAPLRWSRRGAGEAMGAGSVGWGAGGAGPDTASVGRRGTGYRSESGSAVRRGAGYRSESGSVGRRGAGRRSETGSAARRGAGSGPRRCADGQAWWWGGLRRCSGGRARGSRRLLPLIRGHGVGPGLVPVLLAWCGGDRATGAGRLGVGPEPGAAAVPGGASEAGPGHVPAPVARRRRSRKPWYRTRAYRLRG
ncbi:hypothetical protein SVIOM74S_02257 [Streptomyces violarus]